ncbi:hypothetical protein E2562_033976 [Oryza meyeriana var. granulata]|uniref:Uncharacterized protein n=1 Tax=Oryza meyeriana var. granulata TaxID=110450 RepID=A0A6G1C1R1_9ORYZ|nr:hypothetical protein E2562_033976 [Oryza meyeriana var. granulata]
MPSMPCMMMPSCAAQNTRKHTNSSGAAPRPGIGASSGWYVLSLDGRRRNTARPLIQDSMPNHPWPTSTRMTIGKFALRTPDAARASTGNGSPCITIGAAVSTSETSMTRLAKATVAMPCSADMPRSTRLPAR